MGIELKKISKQVGQETHLYDMDIHFESGSRNILLGRTLAGKTSLLRIIAGLDRPTSGQIIVEGHDVTNLSVRKRNIAMVYQQFINYPSLTIYDNIASPLKIAGLPKAEIRQRVLEAATMLHLEEMLDRLPSELSGGQQQRTAIARALVKESELLLLDEPLVNLDYKLREELREELRQIFEERSSIVIYTTTEPQEALMIGGNIVVLDEGRILQTGPAPEVYRNPATLKVAEIFSDPPINKLPARIAEQTFTLRHGPSWRGPTFPLTFHLKQLMEGEYILGLRSHHLSLHKNSEYDLKLKGSVELSEMNGSETFVHINLGSTSIVLQENGIHSYTLGEEITFYLNPAQFVVFDMHGKLIASPGNIKGVQNGKH